ncbi:hypothetical protein POM88_017100 [Heracleum sosnowskyi]|uniref:Uncharacterized protein n=1 Tax=Heracleum sosnowskyi TaxID=360622 RepID=A0AAD8MY14_9APIA|nr:hypothetical protein POM88_017100 [Heracleum sosnowskyi]
MPGRFYVLKIHKCNEFETVLAFSVVFIDELDAVGKERGLIKGSGGQERDATLNQLLVSLDGFEGRGNVITIASTNRPDILDPALVRPGRFDRKIFIPKPGLIGRVEILKVHARKKPMAVDVDYMAVASMTDGMVGAELANIIEVGAINMMREGRTEITTDDLLQAAQVEDRGMLDRKDCSPEIWKQVAINEATMAVVAVNFPDLRNIEFFRNILGSSPDVAGLGKIRLELEEIVKFFTHGEMYRRRGDELKLQDYDIEHEVKGVDKAVKPEIKAVVTDKTLEIRLVYTGKGTIAVPTRGTYGPFISAISIESDNPPKHSSSNQKKKDYHRGCSCCFKFMASSYFSWNFLVEGLSGK